MSRLDGNGSNRLSAVAPALSAHTVCSVQGVGYDVDKVHRNGAKAKAPCGISFRQPAPAFCNRGGFPPRPVYSIPYRMPRQGQT